MKRRRRVVRRSGVGLGMIDFAVYHREEKFHEIPYGH
jgi:hypothetical protein